MNIGGATVGLMYGRVPDVRGVESAGREVAKEEDQAARRRSGLHPPSVQTTGGGEAFPATDLNRQHERQRIAARRHQAITND